LRKSLLTAVVLIFSTAAIVCGQQTDRAWRTVHVEIFQVLGLPINIHEADLVSNGFAYAVRLRVSNETTSELLGVRYALKPIDADGRVHNGMNPIEGFALTAHESKTITFNSRMRLSAKPGYRYVLMVEQVISRDSIWEVVKSKDALDAYLKGDYSIQPTVMRVANAVDAPPQTRVIY